MDLVKIVTGLFVVLFSVSQLKMARNQRELKIVSWNCNGLSSKTHELDLLLAQHSPDIFCLCETKLDPTIADNELTKNYTIYRRDQTSGPGRGGGVLIGLSNGCPFNVSRINSSCPGEIIALDLSICGFSFTLACYYRRPIDKQIENIMNWYYNQTCPNIVIVGDFNLPDIDWINCSLKSTRDSTMHTLFLDFLECNNLLQLVNQPTHDKGNTLDLVVTNLNTSKLSVESSCSDHFSIVFNIVSDNVIKRSKSVTKPKPFWDFSKADGAHIMLDCFKLEQDISSSIESQGNPELVWHKFKSGLLQTAHNHIPFKFRKHKSELWITNETKREIRKRKSLHLACLDDPTPYNLLKHNEQSHYCKKLCNRDYNSYINNHICNKLEHGDSKPLYRFIASKRGSSNIVNQLDNVPPNNNTAIAECFADSFASVFTLDDGNSPPFQQADTHSSPILFDPNGVLKQLLLLDPRKGAGPDELSPALLKFLAPYMYVMLCKIFQYFYDINFTPNDWRCANIVPLFKKGSRSDPLNYRPISITSIISKIFEHIVSHNLNCYLESNQLFYDHQHGFRSKHGCDTQLLNTVSEFIDYYDEQIPIDIAVLDFSKAFDVVSHHKLKIKMLNLGIHSKTVDWIASWLQHRSLSVCVNNTKSSSRNVCSGVPQGSVLGPLLFNIFINDMNKSVAHSILKLYADDSLLYKPILNSTDSDLFQIDLNSLVGWADASQMKFNVKKCEQLCIKRLACSNSTPTQYTMSGEPLSSVDHVEYLGVTIDCRLSFDQHIKKICSKANKSLHMLMRCLKKASPKTKSTAYKTICRPILEFATHTWSPHKIKYIKQLEGINRKAFRWVFRLKKRDHISDLMVNNYWETLEQRRIKADVKMCNRMLSGTAALDESRFTLHFSAAHNTRHGATKGTISTDVAKYSFRHRIHKLL